MAEDLQTHPVIEYVHTIVTRDTNASEGINAALRQFEAFLIPTLSELQQKKSTPTFPILVEHPVFKIVTKRFPELNGDTPPVAILKTIAKETGRSLTGEVELFKRIKKNRQRSTPTDVFVLREEDIVPSPEPEKPFKADRQVRNGEMYSSITAFRHRGVEVGYNRLKTLLADLPTAIAMSRNGRPVLLYSEKEAEKAITQWIEETARKSALKESRPRKLDSAVWVPTTHYANVYDISRHTVKRILQETSTTTFGNTRFYRRDQADKAFKQYYSKKPINGVYFRDNEPRVTVTYLSTRTGIDKEKLRNELGSLTISDEVTGYTFYPLVDSLEKVKQITGIPHVARDGIYTDEDNRSWAKAVVIRKLLRISSVKLDEYLEGAETIPLRGNKGKPSAHDVSAAYEIAKIRERASSYLSRPTLKEVKSEDSTLITAGDLAEEYGLPGGNICLLLSAIRTPLRGTKVGAYPRQDARAQLDAFTALPKMDRKKSQYIDADGIIYVGKNEARIRLHSSDIMINEAIDNAEIRHVTARGQIGTFELYSLTDLRAYKNLPRTRRSRRPKSDMAELEQEGREILASGDRLDSKLRQTHPGFNARVDRNYPGKLAAFREALGVGDTVRKKVSYKDMTQPEINAYLEAEGERMMEEGIGLFTPELRASKNAKLENAVRKYYTKGGGGLEGWRNILEKKNRDTQT